MSSADEATGQTPTEPAAEIFPADDAAPPPPPVGASFHLRIGGYEIGVFSELRLREGAVPPLAASFARALRPLDIAQIVPAGPPAARRVTLVLGDGEVLPTARSVIAKTGWRLQCRIVAFDSAGYVTACTGTVASAMLSAGRVKGETVTLVCDGLRSIAP